MITVRTIAPMIAPGLRHSRRNVSRARLLAGICLASETDDPWVSRGSPVRTAEPALLIADPGVDDGVGEVDHQADEDVDDGRHQDGPLDEREIAVADGRDRHPPQSGTREDLFGDDGAGEEPGQLDAE